MDDTSDGSGVGPTPAGSAAGPEHHEVRTVPAGGISVWAQPDATQSPVAELAGGEQVTVVGRRGRWVHVAGSGGVDGWADGPALAGVALGASGSGPVADHAFVPEQGATAPGRPRVVEKQRMPLLLGTGPILGLLGAGVVVLGTVLPWFRQVGGGSTSDAYGVPLAFLGGWRHLAESGFDLGTALLIAAIVGGVVSMVRGGGIVRRVIGLAMILVCALYVLQWQDFLNVGQAGLGTGTNVWDIADYGVLVSFGGAVVMLGAPSR